MTMRISHFIVFFSLFFVFSKTFATSTIISTDSFKTVEQLIKKTKNPNQMLLAMDDDDTLTMMPCPSPTHCQYLGGPAWYNWQSKLPTTNPERIWKTFPELLDIANLLYNMSDMVIDDPAIPNTLKTADKLGVATLVITDRGYRMVHATERQFSQDHIFSLVEKNAIETPTHHISFPGFYFPEKWDKNAPRHIAYVHGTLYDAGQNKGIMIQQFLQKTNSTKRIREIIFIDDTMKNVQDVANAYKNDPSVHVIAIHFTKLEAHKAAFLTGKNAKQLQTLANEQWYHIRDTLRQNLVGFSL